MKSQTDLLKEFVWLQILAIWNDNSIAIDKRIRICTELSTYMNSL